VADGAYWVCRFDVSVSNRQHRIAALIYLQPPVVSKDTSVWFCSVGHSLSS
jgi:hypothetical protein